MNPQSHHSWNLWLIGCMMNHKIHSIKLLWFWCKKCFEYILCDGRVFRSRRIEYGYQLGPKGTATRNTWPLLRMDCRRLGRTPYNIWNSYWSGCNANRSINSFDQLPQDNDIIYQNSIYIGSHFTKNLEYIQPWNQVYYFSSLPPSPWLISWFHSNRINIPKRCLKRKLAGAFLHWWRQAHGLLHWFLRL